MSDTETLTITIPRDSFERLHDLASRLNRSEAAIASEALETYLAVHDSHVAAISEALAASRSGTPTIPHLEVEVWLQSWGIDHELPPPR
jgi:predicted transcriptional regulator